MTDPGPHDADSSPPDNQSPLSLNAALTACRIPVDNHALIRQICARIGTSRYEKVSDYIKAVRAGDGPNLEIHWGFTNGFRSESEARQAARDDVVLESSGRGKGLWVVWHPINRIGHGGGGTGKREPEYAVCQTCYLQLPATGVCDNCG